MDVQNEMLTTTQKNAIRYDLIESARKLLGVPYVFGAEWTNYTILPEALDCSELIEGIFHLQGLKMPDGNQNQYDATFSTPKPIPGDLGFFGRGGNPHQIYHVGMVFSETEMIEARGLDPAASFETGKVILRPISAWVRWKNFVGFNCHQKLI